MLCKDEYIFLTLWNLFSFLFRFNMDEKGWKITKSFAHHSRKLALLFLINPTNCSKSFLIWMYLNKRIDFDSMNNHLVWKIVLRRRITCHLDTIYKSMLFIDFKDLIVRSLVPANICAVISYKFITLKSY